MNTSCSECGRELPPKLSVTGRRRLAMLEILLRRPNGLTDPEIREYVYRDDEDGGAETRTIVSSMKREINQQIRSQGWEIYCRGGPGAVYRLRRL